MGRIDPEKIEQVEFQLDQPLFAQEKKKVSVMQQEDDGASFMAAMGALRA